MTCAEFDSPPERYGKAHQCRSGRARCANASSRRETRPDVNFMPVHLLSKSLSICEIAP